MKSLLFFLMGTAIGSFLNVLIDRLPKGEDVVFGRSKCDFCNKALRWFELIPLLSFILQRGRCRRCHKRLTIQYPFVELLTGISFVLVSLYLSPLWFAIVSVVVVIVLADFKYQIIPDSMLVILLVISLFVNFDPLVGLGSGLVFYILWLVTKGRGMGFGDVKLSAVLGTLLGFPQAIIAFYMAFLTGALYGVILMITRKAGMKSRVAFGPFLLFGSAISVFWTYPILLFFGFI